MTQMDFAANTHLFPLRMPGEGSVAWDLERSLVRAMRANMGKLVSAYAIIRNGSEEITAPVTWTKPRDGDTPRAMVERKVAELALSLTREGSLLIGFK
jgi:hypothetical protein